MALSQARQEIQTNRQTEGENARQVIELQQRHSELKSQVNIWEDRISASQIYILKLHTIHACEGSHSKYIYSSPLSLVIFYVLGWAIGVFGLGFSIFLSLGLEFGNVLCGDE